MGYTDGITVASYAYDALERRVAKTVDGTTDAFVYDPWNPYSTTANDILLEFSAGVLTNRWLHSTSVDEPLGFETYTGTTAGGTGSAHEMFADRLGSIIEIVETATGTVAASYTYDAFGQRTQTGGLSQRYGFTGREVDAETGLMYFRARHYDPALGQFIQRDPIGFAAGDLNLYAYTWNDPFNWTDPSGLAVTLEQRPFWASTFYTGARAMQVTARWCLKNPSCRSAALDGINQGLNGLGDALGIGQPSGSSNTGAGASGAGDMGLGSIFGGTLGLVDKIGSAMQDIGRILKSETTPEEGESGEEEDGANGQGGDDGNGGDGDGNREGLEFSDHAWERMKERGISPDDVRDALNNPVDVRPGTSDLGPTSVYKGRSATVVVGERGIITVW